MKISELQQKLAELKTNHGDVVVSIIEGQEGLYVISDVYYDEEAYGAVITA